ncbi:TetR/AcrR family transcriptional regulator [Kitasatospora sp. NPDC002551]|uniref:TetR/AcrR family transcriptional regulator n=1 Tax=Kitasatospora sp. NPDC002551 TaxID=3154539 RepID=UPI00332FC36D
MATRRTDTTQESRRLLMTAAAELFAERGYRGTTFADIAERSGISRGSIPWHFGNKEGLLAAVIEHLLDTVRAGFGTPEPGPGALDRALREALTFTRQPTTMLFVTLLAEAVDTASPLHRWYGDLHQALRERLRACIDPAELPEGATQEDVGTVMLAIVMGLNQQWRIAPEAVDLDHAYATVGALFQAALAAPAAGGFHGTPGDGPSARPGGPAA